MSFCYQCGDPIEGSCIQLRILKPRRFLPDQAVATHHFCSDKCLRDDLRGEPKGYLECGSCGVPIKKRKRWKK